MNKIGNTLKIIGWIILGISGLAFVISILGSVSDGKLDVTGSMILISSLLSLLFSLILIAIGEGLNLLHECLLNLKYTRKIAQIQVNILNEPNNANEDLKRNVILEMDKIEKVVAQFPHK